MAPTFSLTDISIRGRQTNSQVIVSGVPSRREKKGRPIAGYFHLFVEILWSKMTFPNSWSDSLSKHRIFPPKQALSLLEQQCVGDWQRSVLSIAKTTEGYEGKVAEEKLKICIERLCISQIKASTSPPPPGIPRAFDVFSCPAGGNLINLIFPGAGI